MAFKKKTVGTVEHLVVGCMPERLCGTIPHMVSSLSLFFFGKAVFFCEWREEVGFGPLFPP